MRAKAGLLILLIGMISLTGFSKTTDLSQNSDVITISDVTIGNYVVLQQNTISLNDNEAIHFKSFELFNYHESFVKNSETVLKEASTPPLTGFNFNRIHNINSIIKMKYTKKQLVAAQEKYNSNYLESPDDFEKEINPGDAAAQINYLLSLVEV